MLLRKDTAIVILALGVQYMTYTCLQASLSTLFMDIYEFSQLQAGLIYLPYGVGCASMAFCAGLTPVSSIRYIFLWFVM